jgi:vitamin B12/bleomycin/antimicrobial peptide transport system ATP-binding/permease protein
MQVLSLAVAMFAVASLAAGWALEQTSAEILGVFAVLAAVATFLSRDISAFLKILVSVFATEVILFGGAYLFGITPYWPSALAAYRVPDSLCMTVAFFTVLVWGVSHVPVVRTIARIADRYFEAEGMTTARIWPFAPFQVAERRLAVWMIVFLIVLNQAQVGINVRLSFFGRDWFNAIQKKDASSFSGR